ncbi:MAG: Secretory pathway protein [Candidatus Taylorbacteria bacterium]|nr:Secretory pathway protein [Candidatus Taylorbacteria bacterium]
MNRIANTIPEQIDMLLTDAIGQGASDIHIDPGEQSIHIRYRIDGLLRSVREFPKNIHPEIIARIKVLSGLRTDLHSTSQDGRCRFVSGKIQCDMRVSVVPTQFGENTVLRMLPMRREETSLVSLGFTQEQELLIRECAQQSHGMILVTGPTGAGKTSTQYGIISLVNASNRAIVTLEDPVEYMLPGVRQIPINPRHGLSFAHGLRAVLRQDPDVIMLGEIRDAETAQIATHTALTGHLLISTLHTNSAADALPRLIDMGIDPYLVASTLSLVINQRLVRRICTSCSAAGCGDCRQTGYRGRTVVAEVLQIDEKLQSFIMRRLPRNDIVKYAQSIGMRTIYEEALAKVEAGITTREEVLRVLSVPAES